MCREQLRGRTRQPGESLPQLAQVVESLVRHVYPVAPEEMVTVLSQDPFINALEDQQVQINVKQAHPADMQQTLVRAMQFEAFLCTSGVAMTPHRHFATQNPPRRHIPVLHVQVQQGRRSRTSSGVFSSSCWKCGNVAIVAVTAEVSGERARRRKG